MGTSEVKPSRRYTVCYIDKFKALRNVYWRSGFPVRGQTLHKCSFLWLFCLASCAGMALENDFYLREAWGPS